LGDAIRAMDISATGTSLRGIARVNAHHCAPLSFRLIGQERPEAGEAPGVQAAARFPATLLGAGANMHQILHDDHSTGLDGIDDTPTEHVVAIAAEAVNLPGQLFKRPLGRAGAFRLKRALQSEVPAVDVPPAFAATESMVGADSGTRKPQVHAYSLARRLELHVGKGDDDMQPEPALVPDQVGAVKLNGLFQEMLSMGIGNERNFEPSCYRRQADDTLLRLEGIGTGIVADRNQGGGWTRRLAAFFLEGKGGFYRLRRPDTCRDDQLRGQAGKPLAESIVGCMVQPDTVLLPVRPAMGGDGVETGRVLAQRFQKRVGLLARRVEAETYRSLHIHMMLLHLAEGGKAALLPVPKARGLRAAGN
jgi:hypothetical protein